MPGSSAGPGIEPAGSGEYAVVLTATDDGNPALEATQEFTVTVTGSATGPGMVAKGVGGSCGCTGAAGDTSLFVLFLLAFWIGREAFIRRTSN